MWCDAGVASDAASAAGDTTRPTELGRRPNSSRGTYLSRQYYRYVLVHTSRRGTYLSRQYYRYVLVHTSRRGTYLSRQYYRYVLFIPVVEVRTCHASITGMYCSYQS